MAGGARADVDQFPPNLIQQYFLRCNLAERQLNGKVVALRERGASDREALFQG